MATCVQAALKRVTGLPSLGTLPDSLLFPHGLAVLRDSKMPAVLCEVAFINNIVDRSKLCDPDFQQRVANAICEGVRGYVEGTSRTAQGPTKSDPAATASPAVQAPSEVTRGE